MNPGDDWVNLNPPVFNSASYIRVYVSDVPLVRCNEQLCKTENVHFVHINHCYVSLIRHSEQLFGVHVHRNTRNVLV